MTINLPQNPIFIVGYARSGTTLLQGLLATQPGIYTFPETHYFNVVEKEMTIDRLENIHPLCLDRVWQTLTDKIKLSFTDKEKRTFLTLAKQGKLTSKYLFEEVVIRLLTNLYPGFQKETPFRWLEKTPHHANFLDRILSLYPQAQALYIQRHPVAAICSRKHRFPFNKETPVNELAEAWKTMQHRVATSGDKFPYRIYSLRYEDLVADLGGKLDEIATFLNLDFDLEKTGNFSQGMRTSAHPDETWKIEDSLRPLANTNDRYRDMISPGEAEEIEKIIMAEMTKAGYKPYFS